MSDNKYVNANEPVLEVSNLTVIRSGDTVIKDASFVINRGEYVGIVGPNGGGKTTLLLALLGILSPKTGNIRLFKKNIKSFAHWERVAYIAQDAINFDAHFPLTVRELVGLGRLQPAKLGHPLSSHDWQVVDKVLSYMDLTDISSHRIGKLSGGQKQRLFVAKALVRNPDILFLDEPITGIDATAQETFFKKLSDLNTQKGITIIIVSHDLAAVFCRMSTVICVNREVHRASITNRLEPNEILRKAYGDHFHFVFHQHECAGAFNHE